MRLTAPLLGTVSRGAGEAEARMRLTAPLLGSVPGAPVKRRRG